jgi:DNA-directed RNA polymerase beta' subunit
MPGESTQYQRFINGLKSSGVHPVAENGKIRLKALTDDHIQQLAGDRELLNPKGLDWSRDGDPHPGGLFDKKIFGEGYNLWGKIKLHEKLPNPAFEDPVRYTLGLTEKQMRKVIAGQAGFSDNKFVEPEEGKAKPDNFKTGSSALYDQLKNVDLDKEIANAHGIIAGTKKTKRDAAIRRLKYLQGAKDQGVHPSQWMIENVPVLPPRFRPVSKLQGSNTELVSDPNYLYQDLFHANQNLKSLHGRLEDLSEEKLALYDSLKAVTGLGDPINPKTQQKNVKGMLRLLLAESPKWSIPQHKLLSSPVDLVGRSTIAPDASLDMDEIGIPEDMAFKTYSRFVIKNLVQGGMSPVEADRMVENKSPEARTALLKEMDKRPISYHRAPVLHQFGHIGAWPKLIKGDVIKMSPFVYKGMGADNDGDTVNIHVPVYDKEIDDITGKMMPSKNLLSVKDFEPHYKPEREFHVGLWQATEAGDKDTNPSRKRTFQDMAALKAAFAKGEVTVRDHVTVLKH